MYAAMSDVGEAAESHRHRLPVERALLRAEELLHEPLLRAREDVRSDLALVLDVAPQDRVGGLHLPRSWNSSNVISAR